MSLIICACNTEGTRVCSEDIAGVHDAEGRFTKTRDGIIKSLHVSPDIIFAATGLILAAEWMKAIVKGLAHLSFNGIAEAIPLAARELMKNEVSGKARLAMILTGWDREKNQIRAVGWFRTENFEPREARMELGAQHLVLAPGQEAQDMASDLLKRGATLPETFSLLADAFSEIGRVIVMHAVSKPSHLLSPSTSAGNVDGESATIGSQATGWTLGNGNNLVVANDFTHTGTKSLKITNAGTSGAYSFQDVSVTGGRVYSLQGWIKTDAMTGAGNGALLNMDIVSGVTGFTIISKTGTDFSATQPDVGIPADGVAHDWTFVRCLFKPTGSGVVRLYCQLGNNSLSVTGSAWFDDVGIFPTGASYTSLTQNTGYYLYTRIRVSTSSLEFVNGSPPGTSPSDTLAAQCALDGFIPLPAKKVTTPTTGNSGSDTGGGSGTCPEFDAPVFVRRYSPEGDLILEGQIKAGEVQGGYESDDGATRRGDFLRGYSFKQGQDVYRAVHHVQHVPCAGWMRIDDVRFTVCETIWDGPIDGGQWLPAYKVPGAKHENSVGVKVLIQVEADWDDEHNYYAGGRLIHNIIVSPC